MGGSKKYEGNANMSTAHARLAREMDMRMEHFDIVVEHLGASLQDLNVPQVGLQSCIYLWGSCVECQLHVDSSAESASGEPQYATGQL